MNNTLELTVSPQSTVPAPVVDVDVDKLDTAQPLELVFQPYQTVLDKWAAKAAALVVTDISQKAEMKIAREARLELKITRCALETRRKELVENLKARTGKIDLAARMVRTKIEMLEEQLRASEEFAERYAAQPRAELKAKREAEIAPFRDVPLLGDISDLSEVDYQTALADAKLLRKTKMDAAARLEAARLAKEGADRADRERIAAENARLKAEAEATAKRLEAERKRVEAERQAERVEAERQAEALRQKLAAERKAAEDLAKAVAAKADAERRAIEAKAKAAADRARDEARKLAAESAKLKAELEAKTKAEALAAAAELARVETERKAQESAARRAAAAPDKAKLEAYLVALDAIQLPQLSRCTDTALIEAEYVTFTRHVRKIINAMIQINTQLL